MPEPRILQAPSKPGVSVIEASAGAGKTWTIAHLVPYYLIQGVAERLDEIVLVTFTEAAAGELSGRVRGVLGNLLDLIRSKEDAPDKEPGLKELLGDLRALSDEAPKANAKSPRQIVLDRLALALDESDRLLACTIHSFCRRVLTDEAFLCSVPTGFEVKPDSKPLRAVAVRDLWRRTMARDPLLAAVATQFRWNLDADLDLIRLAADRRRLSVEPDLDLDAERARLLQLLTRLKEGKAQLAKAWSDVQALISQGAEWSASAPGQEDVAAALGVLAKLDPQKPDGAVFSAAGSIAKLPRWIKKGRAKKDLSQSIEAANERFTSLPLVDAAQNLAEQACRLHWAWQQHVRVQSRAAFERALRKANALDYDHLIKALADALDEGRPGRASLLTRLQRRWKIGMVDESQDTSPEQVKIFKAIFGDSGAQRLIFIGDPKQSIYGFLGADPRAYEHAKQGAKEILALTRTHRSAPGLVAALNCLFERAKPALADPDLRVPEAQAAKQDQELPLPTGKDPGLGARLVACLVPERDRAGWTSNEARRTQAAQAAATAVVAHLGLALGQDTLRPEHCAVLTGTHLEARMVQDELSKRGVPCVIQKNGDVLKSESCKEWRALLAAILAPGDRGLRRAALATRSLGYGAKDLLALGDEEDEEWRQRFVAWRDLWQTRGLAALMEALEEEPLAAPLTKLALRPDGERWVTDLRHLFELAQSELSKRHLGPDALLEWLDQSMAAADDFSAPEERLRRLEKDGSAVQILTMHSAKGLEFDFVFCPFLWDNGWMPRGALLTRQGLDEWLLCDPKLGDESVKAQATASIELESLQERLRLTYVALTRAKRRAWFIAGWVDYQGAGGSRHHVASKPNALDWLLRDRQGLVEAGLDADDPKVWLPYMVQQKKRTLEKDEAEPGKAPACPHEQALAELTRLAPGIFATVPLAVLATAYTAAPTDVAFPEALQRGKSGYGEWFTASFTSFTGHDSEPRRKVDLEQDPSEAPEATVPLDTLPRSNVTGNALHWLLEHWDFGTLEPKLVEEALDLQGLNYPARAAKNGTPVPAASDLLRQALPALAKAKLPALGVTLGEAARDKRFSELAFLLPLKRQRLDGPLLADLFETHGDERLKAYGASLAALPREIIGGMLTGSIDRLVRSGMRWAVVDWKSNHLGSYPRYYGPEQLWVEAEREHYVLQLHLYMIAARRYLALRGQGDTLDHACLAFLRGMASGTDQGIFTLKPPPALLAALDALFAPAEVLA